MKKLISSLLFIAVLFCTNSIFAQKELTEGYIKMEITDVTSDDEQVAAMLEMMKGSQTELHFKDGQNLTTANMMGGMVQTKSLFNEKEGNLTMLMDIMGQKMNVESSKEELEKLNADQKEMMEDMKVTYDEGDTKEILGYKCVKAKVENTQMGKMAFEMYVSKDIKASSKSIQGLQNLDLEGFPLELVLAQPQMTMTMTAVELKEEVDENVFKLDKSGYTKMTMEEFMEKMGSMGGGMGF